MLAAVLLIASCNQVILTSPGGAASTKEDTISVLDIFTSRDLLNAKRGGLIV